MVLVAGCWVKSQQLLPPPMYLIVTNTWWPGPILGKEIPKQEESPSPWDARVTFSPRLQPIFN